VVDVPAATWPTLKTVSVTENVPPAARTGEVGVMAAEASTRLARVTVIAPVVATAQLLVSFSSTFVLRSSAQASRK
jgi:hypothetical protein